MYCKGNEVFSTPGPGVKNIKSLQKSREGSRENYMEEKNENTTQFKRNELFKTIRSKQHKHR